MNSPATQSSPLTPRPARAPPRSSPIGRSHAAWLLALIATASYVVLVAAQLGRPLMYDDANFALAIKAAAATGLPFGNQGWMSERGDFSQQLQWALWHPPLYVYLDAVLVRLAGWTPAVMRLVGLAGGVATAILTYLLASEVTASATTIRRVAGGLAVALTMTCPLVLQSTLIIDIDFPVLLPLTLLFLLLYLRLEASPWRWLVLAGLFGLLLWTKMTNPLPLIGIILVWQVLRGQPMRGVVQAAAIGLGGVAAFAVTWVLIGRWLGFPLDMPFGVNLVQWQDSADVARRAYQSPAAFIQAMQPTVLWIGPGLVALGLVGLAVRGAGLVRNWQFLGIDLLIGVLLAFTVGYVNKNAGWFPKYQVAMVPLLACLAAPPIAHAWQRQKGLLAVGVAGAAFLGAGLVTGTMIRDSWALQQSWLLEALPCAWMLGIVGLGALAGAPRKAFGASALAALVGVSFGWALALDLIQVRAPYQTDYWYGTRGTLEAARWVDEHLTPDQPYLSAKEVAIRTHDLQYVDQDNAIYFLTTGRPFDGTWNGQRLVAMVTWQREPYVADVLNRSLPALGYHETQRFGDYVVYEPVGS
jgi:4-amino-4-deoxy-L-arabinose transferase-like glycosyltransferase